MSKPIRLLLGCWTAGNHHFDHRLRCVGCGVRFRAHNKDAGKAMEIVQRATAEHRRLLEAETERLTELRPAGCDFKLAKLRRERTRKKRQQASQVQLARRRARDAKTRRKRGMRIRAEYLAKLSRQRDGF